MKRIADLCRSVLRGSEARLARGAQRRDAESTQRAHRSFERELMPAAVLDRLVVGRCERVDGSCDWVSLRLDDLLGRFWFWTGATGAGKSMAVLGVLLQLFGRVPIVVLDAKGELSALLRREVFPRLSARDGGEDFAASLRIVRPFGVEYVPHLRITAREPGVPTRVQALGIATSLTECVGGELGHRMHRVFTAMAAIAIERGESLAVLVEWLRSPVAFARAAAGSVDAELRAYAVSEFKDENKESIRALRSRLAEVLFVPQVRECLETPACLSFHDCLESGTTLIDASDPPGGIQQAKRLIESLVIGRLTRAILSRQVAPQSPAVKIVFEEFQEAVRAHEVENLGRLLAQARYKRVCLSFVCQQGSQLDPALRKLLRTNCAGEVAFRCSLEDAESLARALPLRGEQRQAAAARAAADALSRLPRRKCLLWLKDRPFGGRIVRSPRVDLSLLGDATPSPVIREAIERGSVASRRSKPVNRQPAASPPDASPPTARREFPEIG